MFGSKRTSTPTKPKTLVRAPINGKFRRVARRLFGGGNNTPARNAKSILTRKYRVLRKYPNIVNKYLIAPRSLSPMTPPRRYKPRPASPTSKPRSKGVSIGVGTSVSVNVSSFRKKRAATKIQRAFRDWKSLQRKRNLSIQRRAGLAKNKMLKELKQRHRAESFNRKRIQKKIRKLFQARKKSRTLSAPPPNAVLRIQRVYRGYVIRKKYAEQIKSAKQRAFNLLGMQRNELIRMKRPPSWVTEFFNYMRWFSNPNNILSLAKKWSKSKNTRIAALGIMFIAAVWYASLKLPDETGPPPPPNSSEIPKEYLKFLWRHMCLNPTDPTMCPHGNEYVFINTGPAANYEGPI